MSAELWSDEINALVDAAFETVSCNPSDHESAVAYRRVIAALIEARDFYAGLYADRCGQLLAASTPITGE